MGRAMGCCVPVALFLALCATAAAAVLMR
jgi:hypothetical protein